MTTYLLDPDARLDFTFDWTDWLATGETITAHTVTATTGVTIDGAPTESSGIVTVWLKDGVLGERAQVTCHITTSAGRRTDRTFDVLVQEEGAPSPSDLDLIGARGLVSVYTYRLVTSDTVSGVSAVAEALDDALALIEERLDRTLPHGVHTETLRVSSTGMVYPKASPVTAVSIPAVSASSIQGAGVLVGLVDLYPVVNWSDATPAVATVTYEGGYTIDGATGTTKLPVKLRNAICRTAYNALHAAPLVGVPAGATSVHVGDAGFSGNVLRALDPLDDGILRDIRGYRRQFVAG